MSLGNTEKDYVLSVALKVISELPESQHLVFKGGTCLKKAYFPHYRFSSDLDFSTTVDNKVQLKQALEKTFVKNKIENISFTKMKDLTLKGKRSLTLNIQYKSILPDAKYVNSVRLDIAFDNPPLIEPNYKKIVFPEEYNLFPIHIYILPLKEILAEKVHTIYKRPKPRDLYDFHYLIYNGIDVDIDLVNKKLATLDQSFQLVLLQEKMQRLELKWDSDIQGLMNSYPAFDTVVEGVMNKLKQLL